MAVTAKAKVKTRRRQTCPYCGAIYLFETAPKKLQVKGRNYAEANYFLNMGIQNGSALGACLANAPCPCCGRVQKEWEALSLRRVAKFLVVLSAVALLIAWGLRYCVYFRDAEVFVKIWWGAACVLTALGFYASRNVNEKASARQAKFAEQSQDVAGENLGGLRRFVYKKRLFLLISGSTGLTESRKRTWPIAARILLLAGMACGGVATVWWASDSGENIRGTGYSFVSSPKSPSKPTYQDKFRFSFSSIASGRSVQGKCRVVESALMLVDENDEEIAGVTFDFSGVEDYGTNFMFTERRSADDRLRDIDVRDHMSSYSVGISGELEENRALAGKTLTCKGLVLLANVQPIEGSKNNGLSSFRRDEVQLEEKVDMVFVEREVTVPENFGDREAFEAEMEEYEAQMEAYKAQMVEYDKEKKKVEAAQRERDAQVAELTKRLWWPKNVLFAAGCCFAIAALLVLAGAARVGSREEASVVVSVEPAK